MVARAGGILSNRGQRISFEDDIKPLFREEEQHAMEFLLHPWAYDDVIVNAVEILEQLEAGTMPRDDAWPAEHVALVRRWIVEGQAR